MEILCTRPGCQSPQNHFHELDDPAQLKTTQQIYCQSCNMPLILAGRYVPQKLLGQGGFGAAFLARDRYTPTMRTCVVKQFQPMGNLSNRQMAMAQGLFEREAEVLERIGSRHPQIPDLFAFFPLVVPNPQGTGDNQYFYLVQEYVEGLDLEQELKQKGQLPEAEIQEILMSMLGVLDFVHSQGTIHRDIKPSNIVRSPDQTLHLLDFGAVKEVTAGAGAGSPAKRSTGIYSPGYAPPEQMRGAQVFPATDLYALAVTCAVLLTGETPEKLFDGFDNEWKWRDFVQVDKRLGEVLDRMLQPIPGDRYQSAREALLVLEKIPTAYKATKIQWTPSPSQFPAPNPLNQPQPQPAATPNSLQPQVSLGEFSVMPLLTRSGFAGFEGTLLFIGLTSTLGEFGIGIWGALMGGLIFALSKKLVEFNEMLLIGSITLGITFFFRGNMPFGALVLSAILVGAALVGVIALFTITYRILKKFF